MMDLSFLSTAEMIENYCLLAGVIISGLVLFYGVKFGMKLFVDDPTANSDQRRFWDLY